MPDFIIFAGITPSGKQNENVHTMKASYLGLELSGPVIVSSSPYTSDMRQIELCARHGAITASRGSHIPVTISRAIRTGANHS